MKRRADVVGIFPNEDSIIRLIGAVIVEQKDERQTSSRPWPRSTPSIAFPNFNPPPHGRQNGLLRI